MRGEMERVQLKLSAELMFWVGALTNNNVAVGEMEKRAPKTCGFGDGED